MHSFMAKPVSNQRPFLQFYDLWQTITRLMARFSFSPFSKVKVFSIYFYSDLEILNSSVSSPTISSSSSPFSPPHITMLVRLLSWGENQYNMRCECLGKQNAMKTTSSSPTKAEWAYLLGRCDGRQHKAELCTIYPHTYALYIFCCCCKKQMLKPKLFQIFPFMSNSL